MSSSQRSKLLIAALLVLVTGIVYGQVAGFGFLDFDDNLCIKINHHIVGFTAKNIKWAVTGVINSNWQPMVWLSYMLDSEIAGLDPGVFHLTNLMLHIINTLLLLFLLNRMTGSFWKSSFVAALFALHPLHVESVAWVTERKDVLSTLFWLLTILVYIRYTEKPNFRRYIWVPVIFALGLMAKPMLVTLPIILFLLDYWPLGRLQRRQKNTPKTDDCAPVSMRRLILEKVPLVVLAAAVGVVTVITQRSSGSLKELGIFPLGVRVANAVYSCIAYLCKTIWPTKLAPFYPHPANSLPTWQVVGSAILIIAITWLVIRSRRHPYAIVGWLWYIITLLPVIGLVQVGAQAMADRYTYVPMIGIGIMVAWGVPSIFPQKDHKVISPIALLAIVVITAFSVCTYHQVGYWRNDYILFSYTVKAVENNSLAHNNLGSALLMRGKNEAALRHFRKAARLEPRSMRAQFNVINTLYMMGDVDEAINQTYKLINQYPHEARAYLRLGIIYLRQSKLDLAEDNIMLALRESHKDPKAHQAMGMLLLKRGKVDEALGWLSKAAKLSPEDPDIKRRYKYAKSLKARKAAGKK
ncbi:tetratricopeptide repeat protein [bacterium]|nr:tetratricopeptide repeat protein [bacterium]